MEVVVWQLWSGADDDNLEAVDCNGFLDSCVEDWVLEFWVAADEDQEIGLVNACNSGVHEVLASEVGVEVWSIGSDVDVLAVEAIQQVFEGLDRLKVRELSNFALNFVSRN